MGSPASRQSLPKRTADSPISEPTERSMPPLTITDVSATASRPISTLRRSTSNALGRVRKLVPMAAKTTISNASSAIRICCAGSSSRVRPTASPGEAAGTDIVLISLPVERIRGDRQQDDQPLDRLLPLRLRAEEDEGRADRPEQGDADQGPDQGAAPPRNRRAADDGRGDHLELQPGAGVGIDIAEPD